MDDNRKVALVGTGMVGMSYAYALLNQGICDELVLVDLNRKRAEGEAMDLNHGMAFSPAHMRIYAGGYEDTRDADLVVVAAGVAQREGESRLALLQRNAEVFRSVIGETVAAGFSGIFLIATNPVDIMTRIAHRFSGFPCARVLGSGTVLDTARLRYRLGSYFDIDPRNVHAYVMGEHGESEFVPWSQAMIGTKPILTICEQYPDRFCRSALSGIADEVRGAAQQIISAKGATYYGIGMSLARITRAVFSGENSVFTLSVMASGEYGESDVYVGMPAIVSRNGASRTLKLALTDEERQKFSASCATLRRAYEGIL